MCLNLHINSNRFPKAVLNHHKVLFNKNSNALVKLYPLTMESGRGRYPSVTTNYSLSQRVFLKKTGAILYRLARGIKTLSFCVRTAAV